MQIKNKEDYAKFEEGNTLSFDEFQRYLDSPEFKKSRPDLNLGAQKEGEENRIVLDRDLIPRIKDIIIDSFLAVKNQMNPSHRKNHFELFGYDFLIDEDFRTWIIEVNTNPFLGIPNKFIADLMPVMVSDMLEIVVDPIYPP